jgi:elongator complex protein 2
MASELSYVSVGCNRSVHAADWCQEAGPGGELLAYGAHNAVAIYDVHAARVIRTLPGAHSGHVSVVKWLAVKDGLRDPAQRGRWLVSGGADGAVVLWTRDDDPAVPAAAGGKGARGEAHSWRPVARGTHAGPVTDVSVLRLSGGGGGGKGGDDESTSAAAAGGDQYLITSTSQDCTVRIWLVDLPAAAAAAAAAAPASAPASEAVAMIPSMTLAGSVPLPLKSLPLSATTAWLPGTQRVVMAFGCADGTVRLFLCDPEPAMGPVGEGEGKGARLESAATLDGHTEWVRDLAFVADVDGEEGADGAAAGAGGLLLASASQDKSTRIWRVAYADPAAAAAAAAAREEAEVPAFMRLAAPPRPPAVLLAGGRLVVHLEALLLGHEDWVLSVAWQPRDDATPTAAAAPAAAAAGAGAGVTRRGRPALLTASMDRSLILWTPSDSGAGGGAAAAGGGGTMWMATASMGEAAASCLGFYGARFNRSGDRVLAHSHGGALHLWRREGGGEEAGGGGEGGMEVDGGSSPSGGGVGGIWTPLAACAGHVSDVGCLAWDTAGRWLLTGSQDLTARLHASWSGGGGAVGGWRQLARPQLHGHAIVCLAALPPVTSAADVAGGDSSTAGVGSTVFVSGADEKTLRVFDAPGTFLGTLARSLSPADAASVAALETARQAAGESTGAELPQLSLSNKALHAPAPAAPAAGSGDNASANAKDAPAAPAAAAGGGGFEDDDNVGSVTPSVLSAPPPEEVLAQATLWPEARKLYGHGNDLECVAAHPRGTLVASACKAQSAGAAAIWVWDSARDWRPLGQLVGATLTVVALQFANPTPRSGGGGVGSSNPGGGGGDMLLAASRDRHVALYVPPAGVGIGQWGGSQGGWRLATRVKAHVKALWDAAWAPGGCDTFATGARDKRVKVWAVTTSGGGGGGGGGENQDAADVGARVGAGVSAAVCEEPPAFATAVTAVAFAPRRWKGERLVLAVGLEDGRVHVWAGGGGGGGGGSGGNPWAAMVSIAVNDCHAAAVRALAWQPGGCGEGEEGAGSGGEGGDNDDCRVVMSLASCGADHAVRLFGITC